MGSPAIDVKDILITDADFTFAENTFVGSIPEEVDVVIGILDGPGASPEGISDISYPSVQVSVRGEPYGYSAAYDLADSIKTILHAYEGGVTKNGSWYIGIWADSDPIFLGLDEKNRPEFVINFRIQRSP